MDEESGNLAVRALNHWHSLYLPTYLGLRLLLGQVPDSKSSDFLDRFVDRKAALAGPSAYRKFLQFKGFDSSGRTEFRTFYAASPSAALGEAYVLRLLSGVEGLRNRPCVFSYRWPRSEREGRSYSYFFSGYDARLRQVSSLLRTNDNYQVAVNDIRAFYPSISRDSVFRRLEEHLEDSVLGPRRELVIAICMQVLRVSQTGVAIGPALGHVYGNIALEPVDNRMYQMLRERYVRYVDDIILVAEPGQMRAAQSELEQLANAEGLALHDESGKRDVLAARDWLDNMPSAVERSLGERYSSFVQRIRLFLWGRPERFATLQQVFRDAGIPMPMLRLAQDARYGRFQRFMKQYILTSPRQWRGHLFSRFAPDEERRLLSTAAQLREGFLEAAKRINVQELRPNGMLRRLRVQRLKFQLNRLLNLVPVGDYGRLLEAAPQVDEFSEYRSLVQAVINKRLDPILRLPGPATSSFASIYHELGLGIPFSYDEGLLDAQGVFDSVCALAPFGAVVVPSAWVEGLPLSDREIARLCLFSTPYGRAMGDHSFEDEVRTLQLGEPSDNMQAIVNTRFSDLETLNPASFLSGEYWS